MKLPFPIARETSFHSRLRPAVRSLRADPRDRQSLGLTYAREHAAAIATGDLARDKELAASVLGRTLVPFGRARTTQLAGADATVARGPLWAQAEAMYLHSRPDDGGPRRAARGASLELAATLPGRPGGLGAVQLAARGEVFDPNVDVGGDALVVGSLGANLLPAPSWRVSIFTSLTRFERGAPPAAATAAEVTARLAAAHAALANDDKKLAKARAKVAKARAKAKKAKQAA